MYHKGRITSEWETTISIKSTEEDYSGALNNINNKIDFIFLKKGGIRVSNALFQKKTTVSRRKLLVYYKDSWITLDRTTATEECVDPPTSAITEKCIHRVITHHEKNIRVSYNKDIGPNGNKYTIDYEIEYPANSEYSLILRKERKLIKLFLQDGHSIKRDIMTIGDMFASVMSKTQMWHCFDSNQDYLWAYKWNGIKSKILITNQQNEDGSFVTNMWSDDLKITAKSSRGENIEHLINICCAAEIMEDKIVIIEAIGTIIGKEMYTTEPMANASFLKRLAKLLGKDAVIDGKPLVVQRFYTQPMPNEYNENYDGFILIQDDLVIKWKIPTIDVKCLTPSTFKVGSQPITLDFIGVPGKIYEITHKLEVLRQRNDRSAASSDQEYAVFLDSSKMLLGLEILEI